jgi:hypothetical protein
MQEQPMIMLYRAPDSTTAALLASDLEADGVPTKQAGAMTILYGELGHEALQVEIWVPADRAREARALVEAYYGQGGRWAGRPWACAACGEENESSFEVCWSCAEPRADGPGPPT